MWEGEAMKIAVPEGSRIGHEKSLQGDVLWWYDYRRRGSEWGGGCFAMFWLGGWTVGGIFAIGSFLQALAEGKVEWFQATSVDHGASIAMEDSSCGDKREDHHPARATPGVHLNGRWPARQARMEQ